MVSGLYYGEFVDSQANVARIAQRLAATSATKSERPITPGTQNLHLYPPPKWILAWTYNAGQFPCVWGFNCWQPILVLWQ